MSSAEPAFPAQPALTADALLPGPSGRSLCINLLDDRLAPRGGRRRIRRVWVRALSAVQTGDAQRCSRTLSECARVADLSGTPFDGSALLTGLLAAVDMASYPCGAAAEDQGFAREAARERGCDRSRRRLPRRQPAESPACGGGRSPSTVAASAARSSWISSRCRSHC